MRRFRLAWIRKQILELPVYSPLKTVTILREGLKFFSVCPWYTTDKLPYLKSLPEIG